MLLKTAWLCDIRLQNCGAYKLCAIFFWNTLYFLLNSIAHAYAAREHYNNACLLVFSLRFSTKYRLVSCLVQYQTLCYCCNAVTRWRIVSNTVATQKIFCQGGDTGHWTWSDGGDGGIEVYRICSPCRLPTIGSLGEHSKCSRVHNSYEHDMLV